MTQAADSESPDSQNLEEQLSKALKDLDDYKSKLAATSSLLEEAEELLEFTWEQVESAEEMALDSVNAKTKAHQLEKQMKELEDQKKQLEIQVLDSNSSIRQMQEVVDLAEERAYLAEQEVHRLEQDKSSGVGLAFEQALDLATRKARRYDRGLALLVFRRVDEVDELERINHMLRDSDFFGLINESTFGVILEEDLPYHDIGECIERLSQRIALPYASSIFGADGMTPDEILESAIEALNAVDPV